MRSRRSTTRAGIRPATSCSGRSRPRSRASSATTTGRIATAATSSPSILPGLGHAQAEAVAERIRTAVGRGGGRRGRRGRPGRLDQHRDRHVPARRAVEGCARAGSGREPLPDQAVARRRDRPPGIGPRRCLPRGAQRDRRRAHGPARPDRAARDDRPPGRRPRRDVPRVRLPRRRGAGRPGHGGRDRPVRRLHRAPAGPRHGRVRSRLEHARAARRPRLRRACRRATRTCRAGCSARSSGSRWSRATRSAASSAWPRAIST